MSATVPLNEAALNRELQHVESELARLRRDANRGTLFMTVAGLLLLVLLAGYMTYGYVQIAFIDDHELIAAYGEDRLLSTVPEFRKQLQEEVKRSAPGWAKQLSQTALDAVPEGRKKLGEVVLQYCDTTLGEAQQQTEKEFRDFLSKHKDVFARELKELSLSPKLSEHSLKELEKIVDDELHHEMQVHATALFKTVKDMNENLKYLAQGKELTREAALERRIWMLARRWQKDQNDLLVPRPEAGAKTQSAVTKTSMLEPQK